MAQLLDSIRKAIRASGETPSRIARDTGVARSQLSRLLSGERGVSVEVLERLADHLGFMIELRPKRRRKGR